MLVLVLVIVIVHLSGRGECLAVGPAAVRLPVDPQIDPHVNLGVGQPAVRLGIGREQRLWLFKPCARSLELGLLLGGARSRSGPSPD